jgi:hypothetical protein
MANTAVRSIWPDLRYTFSARRQKLKGIGIATQKEFRIPVARNPDSPKKVLLRLAYDPDDDVQTAALRNPQFPFECLDWSDVPYHFYSAVVENLACPKEVFYAAFYAAKDRKDHHLLAKISLALWVPKVLKAEILSMNNPMVKLYRDRLCQSMPMPSLEESFTSPKRKTGPTKKAKPQSTS